MVSISHPSLSFLSPRKGLRSLVLENLVDPLFWRILEDPLQKRMRSLVLENEYPLALQLTPPTALKSVLTSHTLFHAVEFVLLV